MRAFADASDFAIKNNLTNSAYYKLNPKIIGDLNFAISIADGYEKTIGEISDEILMNAVQTFRDDKILRNLTKNI